VALGKAKSISLVGLAGTLVEVECDISSNLPNFVLVGLPDASLNEAIPRVRSACSNAGVVLPARRITVNLSPAAIPKFGSGFDLAIALSVLAAAGEVPAESVGRWVHIGELGLDSSLRPVRGVLPAIVAARNLGFDKFVVAKANLSEAQLVSGIEVFGASCLAEVLQHHGRSGDKLKRPKVVAETPEQFDVTQQPTSPDLVDVVGQELGITALTVAAAGGHHLLMLGPPGAGKTMLAERLPGILPDLTESQSLETTAIYSLANPSVGQRSLVSRPPFVAPHHSASMTSLVGGGVGAPRPGAISLAHNGVLFLDETPEFQAATLESLRQPLESGQVSVARSKGSAVFPARFQLLLAANPCPCGKSPSASCVCTPQQLIRYRAKLSGPLLDRVDIQLRVQAPKFNSKSRDLHQKATSGEVAARVLAARAAAAERLRDTGFASNARVESSWLRGRGRLAPALVKGLDRALDRQVISMRGYDRCLRLSWTLADLAGHNSPNAEDVAMALFLRGVDVLI
jgi:magnesium chelatase family protein